MTLPWLAFLHANISYIFSKTFNVKSFSLWALFYAARRPAEPAVVCFWKSGNPPPPVRFEFSDALGETQSCLELCNNVFVRQGSVLRVTLGMSPSNPGRLSFILNPRPLGRWEVMHVTSRTALL